LASNGFQQLPLGGAEGAREVRPDLELALCLEEPSVWRALDLHRRLGRCNCVL